MFKFELVLTGFTQSICFSLENEITAVVSGLWTVVISSPDSILVTASTFDEILIFAVFEASIVSVFEVGQG